MNSFQRFIAILISIGFISNLYAFENVIWKQDLDYVAIHNVKTFKKPNDVIADISKSNILTALASLNIEPKSQTGVLSSLVGSDDVTSLFSDKEARAITENVFATLQTLQDDQVLVFSVSDSRSTFLGIGGETLYSSGTIYISGQFLYLLVAEAQVDIQRKYIRAGNSASNSRFASAAELRRFKLSTGDYTSSPDHDWQIQLHDGITQVNQRADWIKIDLSESKQQTLVTQNNQQHLQSTGIQSTANHSRSNLTFKTLKEEESSLSTEKQQKSEIEERLEKLKQLYLNGQIPEQVYLDKVNTILDEI